MLIGELSALGAAFLWSFSSFVFTTISRRIGAIQLNVFRLIVAAFLLFSTLLLFSKPFDVNSHQLFFLALSGVVGLIFGDSFLFKGFKDNGARVTMLIMSSNPAMAAIAAFFLFNERISVWGILGIFITLFGISLVVFKKEEGESTKLTINLSGLIYAFLGAAGQAGGLILTKYAYQYGQIDSLLATFIRILSSVVIIVPATLFYGKIKISKDNLLSPSLWGLVFLGALLGPFLGINLSIVSIIHTKIGIASTLMATVPVIMIPISRIIFKEKITIKAVLGAVIAVVGVAMLFLIS